MRISKLQVAAHDLDVGKTVNEVIGAISQTRTLNEEDGYRVRLVLNELLNNIVEHSTAGSIEVSVSLGPNMLHLIITDDGQGFEYADLLNQDVTTGEALMQDSGRGVFIVQTIAERLHYNNAGNSVEVDLSLG